MSDLSFAALPDVMSGLRSRPLFVMNLKVEGPVDVGPTPGGTRRVSAITGGRFEGERVSGDVLEGGADWQILRSDGATTLEVRLLLKADDGALIGMSYIGLRHGPPEIMAALAKGMPTDPASYYLRTQARFETSAPAYDWINRVLAIGIGDRRPGGPVYSLMEIL